ncbi:MAG: 16S rRNA (cytidine(1402)-2'-O)-methyltransferase [Elusimicrobiota bacterium]
MNQKASGNLYIVATPIGNLEDVTMRSLEILKSVDLVICEDTRTARKLLNRYDISKKTASYYSPKEAYQAGKYAAMLENGTNIAMISECGTPCISDPGIVMIREACKRGINVIPVPGPSALTAALSICGIKAKEVFFAGFIPRKKGARKKYLEKHAGREYAFVFYESKYRIKDTMRFIAEINPELDVCIAREMTKKFEEIIRGSAVEVEDRISSNSELKGEFVVICSACRK